MDDRDVADFLDTVEPPLLQAEARHLVKVFSEVTGFAPRLWGGSMVGFGRYEYRYASGHSGESLASGFAPRKAELSIMSCRGIRTTGTF